MSSGMNIEEAKKIADKMSYREAIMNCLCARCVPYRKATKIKMKRLLKSIDALNIDLDTPMHFTPEQKAWIKKYIIKNAQANYERGAREFAEKIKSDIEKWWYRSELDMGAENVNSLIDGVLSEWQKGTENDV